jgi:hypothetical protein
MTDPVTPETVVAHKLSQVPDDVIKVFNDLIAVAFDGTSAVVYQDDAIEGIIAKGIARTGKEVADRHWLDIEPVYRASGWTVAYDKPGYNESYRASFTFRPAAGRPR